MAITHDDTIRNAFCTTVSGAIDAGGAGSLILQTGAAVEVATVTFNATSFGAPAAGVMTANAFTGDPSATGGTTTICQIQSGAAADVFAGTVTSTGGGGDVELSTNVIPPGSPVDITSATYTACP